MSGIFRALKDAFASPSTNRKSKSTGDLSYPQIYIVKEKELPKLHAAAWKGNLVKVIELCRPDKLNTLDKDGRSPLHLAVAANNMDVVQHLLNEGAKLQLFDRDSRSCLIIASLKGNPKMMELLLNNLVQKNLINMPDKNGLNALFYALKSENFQILKVLLKEKNLDLDHKDKDRNTALHYSVIQKKIEAIELLIEHGADIDAQNADGRTPLMLASQSGDEELVDFLLDYGAEKNIKDKAGTTAINFAEQSHNQNCVDLLRETRPVKQNPAKLSRLKRSISSNDKSEALSNGQTGTLASLIINNNSDNNKKFDKLFNNKSTKSNSLQNEIGINRASKYKSNEDTSEMATEDKSGANALSNNKSDKWDDDSEQDDDSLSYSQEIKEKNNNKLLNSNDFGRMFGNIENEIDIDINPDKKHWVFNPSEENDSHGLDAIFIGSQKKPDPANWTIFVYTSNIKDAGTDANVYIQIFGNKAASAQINLEKKNENPFEKGKIDKFDYNLPDIGKPVKIKIGHDNKGMFSGWHLEKVMLQNNISHEKFVFPCNRWLSRDEQDSKIELELDIQKNEITGGTGEFSTNKLRESWNSVSSWNSSEEDDSVGISNKKIANIPIKANALNQIDEENSKLNETGLSRNSTKNENQKMIKSTYQSGPPGISDFEESFAEDVDSSHDKTNKPNENSLGFLLKNNLPKQNGAFKETKISESNNFNDHGIADIWKDATQINKNRSDMNSNNLASNEQSLAEIWRDASQVNKNRTNPNNNNNNNTSKTNYSFESMSLEVDEVLKSPIMPSKKTSNDTIAKLMFNNSSSGKSGSNTDTNKQPFKTREKTFGSFSDNDEVSHSINDLMNEYDQIKNKENERSKLVHESSVDFLIKNNLAQGMSDKKEGLAQIFNDLKKKETLKKQNSVDSFKKESNQTKKKDVDADSFDQSESLDDLEAMFNTIKNKPDATPVIENLVASTMTNTTHSPANQIKKHNTNGYDNNRSSESFILHSPGAQNNSSIGQLVANLVSSKSSELNSSDSLITSKFHTIGHLAGSPIKADSHDKDTKNKPAIINNDFSDSSDSEIDYVNSSPKSKILDKNNKFNNSGSIGAALGAVIVSGGGLTTPMTSPIMQINRSNPTFANILPELYETQNSNANNFNSPRKPFDDSGAYSLQHHNSLKNEDYATELMNKLRDKNNELEKAKLELEAKLRETEIQKKNFEMAFNNSDRLLAEKERFISNMNTEKIKTELSNKNDLNDIRALRKEISDLKEDKHALENKLAIMQTTANVINASHGQGSNPGSLRSSEDFSQPNHPSQYESHNIKVKALENQIEELNKDRKLLSSCKEDLSIKLDETENEIKKQDEALKLASLKFTMEKKILADENVRYKKELTDINETRKSLQSEVNGLKLQLNEKNMVLDKLTAEKAIYEQKLDREKDESGKMRKNNDSELIMLKEQQLNLVKKLEEAEIKLMTAEKEAKFTKGQIELREKQIVDLKDQLSRLKSEFDINLNLFKKEKEEKEQLLQKCNSLENNIKKHLKEIEELKKYQNETGYKQLSVNQSGPSDNNSYSNDSYYKLNAIEKENIKLHDDFKKLLEKLQKTESELEKYKINAEIEKLNNLSNNSPATQKKFGEDNSSNEIQFVHNDSNKLKMEVQKLRNDFNIMLSKYSNLENSNNELNSSFNSLKTQSANNEKLKEYEAKGRERVDIPALITESQSLNKIAALNNYLIKSMIDPNDSLPDLNQSNIYKAFRNETQPRLLNNYSSFFSSPTDSFLSVKPQSCNKCSTQPYLDLLKYELAKRIELQVAKDSPLSNYDIQSRNVYGNVDKLMTNINNNIKRTNNYDSLYNTLNYPQNSRLSNLSNTDLLNSLRSKFLI